MQPTFVLTLDEELLWGGFDHTSETTFAERYPDLRGVVSQLLALFERHGIHATWALVSHLFLDSCQRGPDGRSHPELTRPHYDWFAGDWLALDPGTNRQLNPLWYGDDIVRAIRGAKQPHEIACHSFSHLIYGDPGCSRQAAESDLQACVKTAASHGVELRSFVFPRNREGHHDLLQPYGFRAYRGQAPDWYLRFTGVARRAAHLADHALGLTPPRLFPSEREPGLWNIPGSMFFSHRQRVRRLLPLSVSVRKAKRGIDQAIATNSLFHLWFHPFNMCSDRVGMFGALDEILAYVVKSGIAVKTMGELAEELTRAKARAA